MSTQAVSENAGASLPTPQPLVRRGLSRPLVTDAGQLVKMKPASSSSLPQQAPRNPQNYGYSQLDTDKKSKALVIEMTRTISIAALEVINGARSIQQLARWLDLRCFNALTTRARLHAEACSQQDRRGAASSEENVVTLHRKPVIHSIKSFLVAPGIFESCVVIADGARFRAMALRLEEKRGVWKVTAMRIG